MSIKPGIVVEIQLDPLSAIANSLKAVIYDVKGKRLVLSQTSPPLLPPPPKGPVDISYVVRKDNSAWRLSFSALVSGFGSDYELSSGMRVSTVIVEMKNDPAETNLRKGIRVRRLSGSGITLAIQAINYPIFDISETGVNFIQSSLQSPFNPSDVLECRLNIDGRDYLSKARVIRVVDSAGVRQVGAAFINPQKDLGSVVSRKILQLQREEEEINPRNSVRVRPRGSSGITLAIQAIDYPIFDISQTGVNFIQSSHQPPFNPSDVLECRLNIDGRDYLFKVRVIRVVETTSARQVGAAFVNPGKDLEPVLGRKILQLQREDMSRRY